MKKTPVIALPLVGATGFVSLVIEGNNNKAILMAKNVPSADPKRFVEEACKVIDVFSYESKAVSGTFFTNFCFVITDQSELDCAIGNPMSLLHSLQMRLRKTLDATGIYSL